jgi:septum formation protein
VTVAEALTKPDLILASASPRRKELLAAIAAEFTIVPSNADESLDPDCDVRHTVERLARAKAASVARARTSGLVLAADTLVSRDGVPLGKPEDDAGARAMLQSLSGRNHLVLTGVAIAVAECNGTNTEGPRLSSTVVKTSVSMRCLSNSEIEESIARRTPFDKAGAYGIQDETLQPVAAIEGCYCNVIGLPLWTAYQLLLVKGADVSPPDITRVVCRECPLRPRPRADARD